MGESASHSAKSPSEPAGSGVRSSKTAQQPAGDVIAPSYAAVLELQRAIGNRGVARLFAAPPDATRGKPTGAVRRAPNASMPPPNQSVAPQKPSEFNNGIRYQGEIVYPDAAACKAMLKRMLPEKGFDTASGFGHSFANAGNETKIGWALFADADYITRTQAAMKSAVTEFDDECRIFLQVFETVAGNLTDQLLTNAEEQIVAEQKKLGMKETVHQTEAGSFTQYSASNTQALNDAKGAARTLATRRQAVDKLARSELQARQKLEAETSKALQPPAEGTTLQANAKGPPQKLGLATSPVGGLPVFVPQALIDGHEQAYKAWQEGEEEFKKEQHAATGKHPSLGPLLTGSTGTAQKLKAFADESAAQSGQRLGEDFATKLRNIQKVRGELGGRFSVWKQPAIISMTHQRQNSGPGEQRLVRDKIRKVTADEQSTKEMWAVIALGLGLLAAIPTGGSSIMAGVAVAASVSGAALSAYSAYESAQDYLLQKASANTTLDRAYQISDSDPSLLYLAMDIASAISDLRGAKAAFVTLRETIAVAKAAKGFDRVPDLMAAMRKSNISASNQGRVLNEVLPPGGDLGKALHDMRQVFIKTANEAADRETAQLMRMVAERAMDNGRVIVIPNNKVEAISVLRFRLAGRGIANEDKVVNDLVREFFAGSGSTAGLYDPKLKLVFVKGNVSAEGAAGVLVHELAHHGQNVQKSLTANRLYQAEFEAFKAQQQFLQMLPQDRVPSGWEWLLRAKDSDIENHVLTAYADQNVFKPWGVSNAAVADGIFNTLFHAGSGL